MAINRLVKVVVTSQPDYRQGNASPPRQFFAQSMGLTWSWGFEPASAEMVYLGAVPVTNGMWLDLHAAGHVFYGVCKSDVPSLSAAGASRTLTFMDNRHYLDWDAVYCAFNIQDERIVGGYRVKRYKHLLPANFNAWRWTYTAAPYTAAQVLDFVFAADTVEDTWTRVYHADQLNWPVLDLNWTSGTKLRNALSEISEKQGLQCTLIGGRFRLVWTRKGEGAVPLLPVYSDNRSVGAILTENATRIRVLGDRNVYQVHGVSVEKDWVSAWQTFVDELEFMNDVFNRGTLQAPITIGSTTYAAGTKFSEISAADDPEFIVARQLANARALEITVQEYVTLRNAQVAGEGDPFIDRRKFAGRSRMDMPAIMYIRQILFRAFRFPSTFTLRNAYDEQVPLDSLTSANRMIARVSHDPVTGEMTWDDTENPDGIGYAIAKGYQVGRDLFETIRPERFKLSQWTSLQDIWQKLEFQIDDSGEGDIFLVFDSPVVNSSDFVEIVDGYGVFKANPTFTTPQIKVAMAFQAEPYSYIKGTGGRDAVENVAGLNGQFLSQDGDLPVEAPFSDGDFSNDKADAIATSLLNLQFLAYFGSYTNRINPTNGIWPTPTQLTGMIDRVNVSLGPNGFEEVVSLTNEAPRQTYVPERDLDRSGRIKQLLPGQAELRHMAETSTKIAYALAEDARARKTLRDAYRNNFGARGETRVVNLETGAGTLSVGTPLWQKPVTVANNAATNTRPVMPAAVTDEHTVFAGVTIRQGENAARDIEVQVNGDMLMRVMGPCNVGDAVGKVNGQSYVSPNADAHFVGVAQQEITTAAVKLIRVRTTGGSSGGGGSPVWL